MNGVAAGTIVAKNYLSFARVLAASFREHHPDVPFVVLLADEPDGWFDPGTEPFEVIGLSDLQIPHVDRVRFRYPQQPLTYAATPYFLAHLLGRGFDQVVFFKQETLVLGNLDGLFEHLSRASIVITPHLLAPLEGHAPIARELNILQSGTFNVGLLGVARRPQASSFLDWWQDRVYAHALHAIAEGMHYEQRWLDLVPSYFDEALILRDPAYNVGHWNLPDRRVTVDGDAVLVDGQPCRVFRFSGYEPDHPTTITRYNRRLTWETVGPARAVFERFRRALEGAGYAETRSWPYAYGAFDNGVPVPEFARILYRALEPDAAVGFGDPLRTGSPASFFRWLNDGVDGPGGQRRTTRLWREIYLRRPDLQQAFPGAADDDHQGFLQWTADFGLRENGIAAALLPRGVTIR